MLWIDPDGLRANGARFQDLGRQARRTFEQLRSALAQEGRCWGDDETGKAFEQTYKPDADRGLAALHQLAEALHDFGYHITTAAADYEHQDLANATRLQNPEESGRGQSSPEFQGRSPADPAMPISRNALAPNLFARRPAESANAAQPEPFRPQAISSTASENPGFDHGPASPTAVRPDESGAATDAGPIANPSQPDEHPLIAESTSSVPMSAVAPAATATPPADPVSFSSRPRSANPAAARDTIESNRQPAATPWDSRARPTISAAADRRPPQSPWTSTGESPWQSARPLAQTRRNHGDQPERHGSRRSNRLAVTAPPGTRWPGHSVDKLAVAANAFAAEHDLAVAGFDTAELDESIVLEFLAAIETVLRTCPLVHLRRVAIDTLTDGAVVRARPTRDSPGAAHSPQWSIVLNRAIAVHPKLLVEKISQEKSSGSMIAGSIERPVYARTVCELGAVLDVSGGMLARKAAQRRLIAEYLRGRTGYRHTSLSRVVGGYKQWRDQLCGHSFEHGRFASAKAVSWAFADVVLNDARATEPAKVLHGFLIDAAIHVIAQSRKASNSTCSPLPT